MALKIKTKNGKIIAYPAKKVKQVLKGAGFTGKLLISTAGGVLKEAGRVAKAGVISVTDLEKAIVKSGYDANKTVIDNTQKLTRKVFK